MNVRITLLAAVNSNQSNRTYTASRREDCRDSTDRSAYDMVVITGRTVKCGAVVASPV